MYQAGVSVVVKNTGLGKRASFALRVSGPRGMQIVSPRVEERTFELKPGQAKRLKLVVALKRIPPAGVTVSARSRRETVSKSMTVGAPQ